MGLIRATTLTMSALLASGWAAVLAWVGLHALLDYAPRAAPELSLLARGGGLAVLALAQFVFMVVVADRLFPAIGSRLPTWVVEMLLFALAAGCVAWAVVS